MTGTVLAVDLGATSGRVISGRVNANSVSLHQNARFANTPVSVWEGERPALYWDILALYRGALDGIRSAVREAGTVAAIGVDSWAVDYARLARGRMLALPRHYRDERTAAAIERSHALVSPAELYAVNGLQFLPFNSLYQLGADAAAGQLDGVDAVLQIPDLLGYWLTGVQRAERTNASTTGLLDLHSGTWSTELLTRLDLPRAIFPELIAPGEPVGALLPSVQAEVGAGPIPVLAVASHDTASAIVAIPSTTHDFAYISSGTWSLVGLELDSPVLTEASRAANFTNEGGVDGTVRYLKNVSGMWLVSQCLEEWERAGSAQQLTELLGRAAALPTTSVFDADHASLTPAGPMTARIAARCAATGVPVPGTPAEFVRAILDSLAVAYAATIEQACALSGTRVSSVHIVGGGSQNALLCQLTANRTGLPVIAGPVEGTAMGNVLIQARGAGLISGDLESLRAIVQRSTELTRYLPR